MSDAQRRAIRTLTQSLPAAVLISGWNLFAPDNLDLTTEQAAWLALVLTCIVSFVQNWFEDNTSFPALLKAPASEGENPQPPH